jgi:hypothetical protein
MAAYGLFMIALLHALLMVIVERGLHAKTAGFASNLPPLLTLEHLLFRAIGAAFVLLTLTLATGIAFSEVLFGRALRSDHKTIFAVLSWLTFGWLFSALALRLRGARGALDLGGTWCSPMSRSRFVLEVCCIAPDGRAFIVVWSSARWGLLGLSRIFSSPKPR